MPQIILPNIDYKYWLNKNRDLTNNTNSVDQEMIDKVKNFLNPKEGDVLWDVLSDEGRARQTMNSLVKKAKTLADEIHNESPLKSNHPRKSTFYPKINEEETTGPTTDEKYLAIFDVIQIWGGGARQGGGNPYQGNRDRANYQNWLPLYKEAVNILKNAKEDSKNDILNAYEKLRDIPQLGKSYASKHLWFWTEYWFDRGSVKETAPVSDMRTDMMIFGKSTSKQNKSRRTGKYDDYDPTLKRFNDIKEEYELDSFTPRDVEKALFSFSKNYFNLDFTNLKQNPQDTKDQEEAERIFRIRQEEREGNQNNTPAETEEERQEREERERREEEERERKYEEEKQERRKRDKEQKLHDRAVKELEPIRRKFERQAYEEIVPQNIRDILAARVPASETKKRKARTDKESYNTKVSDRYREIYDEKIKDLVKKYKEEEESKVNENWNKWAKWATQ